MIHNCGMSQKGCSFSTGYGLPDVNDKFTREFKFLQMFIHSQGKVIDQLLAFAEFNQLCSWQNETEPLRTERVVGGAHRGCGVGGAHRGCGVGGHTEGGRWEGHTITHIAPYLGCLEIVQEDHQHYLLPLFAN